MAGLVDEGTEECLRADWWEEGEEIYIHPYHTHGMQLRARNVGAQLPEGYTLADIRTLDPAEADRLLQASFDLEAQNLSLLRDMFIRGSLRKRPTPAQAAAGELGDLVAVTPALLSRLPAAYGAFLAAEIAKRDGSVPVPLATLGGDFRLASGATGAGAVSGPGQRRDKAHRLGS